VTTTAAAAGTRRHTGTYPAEPRQVGLARAELAGWLGGCPQADEAILIASEFATNAVLFFLHSASRHGGAFTLRAEVSQDRLRIEVEDGGGPWRDGRATTGGRTDSMSWRRSPGRGTGEWTGMLAGASPGPGSDGEMRVDDVHDPVRADPQPVIPASVESLCGVWIIGQGGDGCADSTHAVLVSHVTAR